MSFIINNKVKLILIMFLTVGLGSCKKFIEVGPPTNKITEANIFDNDLTATAVVTGMYANMSTNGSFGGPTSIDMLTISKLGGLSGDELDLWTGASDVEKAYYQNRLQTVPGGNNAGLSSGVEFWNVTYQYLYQCNQAIYSISQSNSLNPFVKKQLLGEVKFLRALLYFYLVNLYGDVPVVTGLDPEINRLLPRVSKVDVYGQIISDLKEAKEQLSYDYLSSDLKTVTIERVRPTKWAAMALLARVYLYTGDYTGAETEATGVIDQASLFDVAGVSLNNVFLKNSKETIWQLQPSTIGQNTIVAQWFVLADDPAGFSLIKSVYLSLSLYNAFQPGDDRKMLWLGSYTTSSPDSTYYFPYKYKKATADPGVFEPNGLTEYEMVLRLAEQYLIRAEARSRQNNIPGAVSDLNVLRGRARATPTILVPDPLPDLPSSLSQTEVMDAVTQERRVELFAEWGHRWLDLKRWDKADAVLGPIKGANWQTSDQLYPIPIEDILRNQNLQQNPGY